jgi:hypothetical protein
MEAAALLAVLQREPLLIDRHVVVMRGAFAPVILPLDGLAPGSRARLMLSHEGVPLDVRVGAALEAGLTEEAWALVMRSPGPLTRSVGLDLVLAGWAAREQARLGLPATRDQTLVIATTPRPPHGLESAIAMSTTREMLAGLSWPRWSGPVVVVVGEVGERDPAPGRARIARPALPIVRLPERPAGTTHGEQLCRELTGLMLDLEAPPTGGWPAWLRLGLMEVVQAKMRGEGPSPLRMHAIRQRAGLPAIGALLDSTTPDAELAMAVCAPLVHTRRRHLLGNLLDLLRGGAQSEGAIRVAYGLTLERLLEER